MKLNEIKFGHAYKHEVHGTCWVVGSHPFDGCAFIVMYNDDEEDEEKYVLTIPEELEYPLVGGDEFKPNIVPGAETILPLIPHLRQFRGKDSDELVFGYDKAGIDELMASLHTAEKRLSE